MARFQNCVGWLFLRYRLKRHREVDEQSDEPKRRIGRFLISKFFGRRWVIGAVRRIESDGLQKFQLRFLSFSIVVFTLQTKVAMQLVKTRVATIVSEEVE